MRSMIAETEYRLLVLMYTMYIYIYNEDEDAEGKNISLRVNTSVASII